MTEVAEVQGSGYTFEATTTLVSITCSCGVLFAIPDTMRTSLRRSHATFYCPAGHPRHYPGKSDIEQAQENARWERDRRKFAEQMERSAEYRRRAAKGQLTKMRRRLANGMCPCCDERFDDVESHLRDAHPDFAFTEPEESS